MAISLAGLCRHMSFFLLYIGRANQSSFISIPKGIILLTLLLSELLHCGVTSTGFDSGYKVGRDHLRLMILSNMFVGEHCAGGTRNRVHSLFRNRDISNYSSASYALTVAFRVPPTSLSLGSQPRQSRPIQALEGPEQDVRGKRPQGEGCGSQLRRLWGRPKY